MPEYNTESKNYEYEKKKKKIHKEESNNRCQTFYRLFYSFIHILKHNKLSTFIIYLLFFSFFFENKVKRISHKPEEQY